MQLKDPIKRAALVVSILALVSITAVAQEKRSEISIQGTRFFTKDIAGNGILERANKTGGFLVTEDFVRLAERDPKKGPAPVQLAAEKEHMGN